MLYQARGMWSSSRTNLVRRVITWAIAKPPLQPASGRGRAGRERSLPRGRSAAQRVGDAPAAAGDGGPERQRQDDDDAALRAALAVALVPVLALAARLLPRLALGVAGRALDRARAWRVGLWPDGRLRRGRGLGRWLGRRGRVRAGRSTAWASAACRWGSGSPSGPACRRRRRWRRLGGLRRVRRAVRDDHDAGRDGDRASARSSGWPSASPRAAASTSDRAARSAPASVAGGGDSAGGSVSAGAGDDGTAAMSLGRGVGAVIPTANARVARTRFRTPRATTRRARCAVVTSLVSAPSDGHRRRSVAPTAGSDGSTAGVSSRSRSGTAPGQIERSGVERCISGGSAAADRLEQDELRGCERRPLDRPRRRSGAARRPSRHGCRRRGRASDAPGTVARCAPPRPRPGRPRRARSGGGELVRAAGPRPARSSVGGRSTGTRRHRRP